MSSLPPGCRFYPTEEQLLCFYLKNKNRTDIDAGDDRNGHNLVKELDLYKYEPFNLPENSCFVYGYLGRRRHWFCYTDVRVLNERRDGVRRAKGGYWRRSGRVGYVVRPGENVVVGTRNRFVFYVGASVDSAVRTDWVLYEYSLLDDAKPSFVLCRVFVRPHVGGSILESCAEESVSAVRHVGVQYDRFLLPDILAVEGHHDLSGDGNLPSGHVNLRNEPNDQAATGLTSVDVFQSLDAPSNDQVRMFADAETAEEFVEGDFLELDDLIGDVIDDHPR